MKLQHTPGPWEIAKMDGHKMAKESIGPIWARGECGDEHWLMCSDDDARLIAAAPEMLEAMVRAYKNWDVSSYAEFQTLIERATGMSIEEVLK